MWGRPFFSLPIRAHVDRNWPISRGKKSKNRPVCKIFRDIALVWELHAPSYGLLARLILLSSSSFDYVFSINFPFGKYTLSPDYKIEI